MDILSRILSNLHLQAPLFSIIEMSGDVSLRTPGVQGVTAFHYAIQGDCRICEGASEQCLSEGEFGIFPHGQDFRIEAGRKVPSVSFLDLKHQQGQPPWSAKDCPERPVVIRVGTPPFTTRLLTGMFVLDTAEAKLLTGGNPLEVKFSPEDTPMQDWTLACLHFVVRECTQPRPGFAAMAERALQLLLADVLRDWVLRNKLTGWARGMMEPRVHRALEAIHEDPSRNWTLQELAKVAGQSRSSFAALFSEIMSETPIAYLTRWRMYLAAGRMKDGLEPIGSVAESLGYGSIFAFSRAFRAHHGTTPSAYRRVHQAVDFPRRASRIDH